MIIQCEKCHTKFNIDDGLIASGNPKVRCSRCKHVFPVSSENPEEIEDPGKPADHEEETGRTEKNEFKGFEDEWGLDETFEDDSMEDIEALESVYGEDFEGIFKEDPSGELKIDNEQIKIPVIPTEKVSEKRRSGIFRYLLIALLIIVIFIGAGYAVYRWSPDFVSSLFVKAEPEKMETPPVVDDGGSRLAILTVDGTFVDSPKSGGLFVVHGKVVNKYPTKRSYLRVKASILDDSGKIIQEKLSYAGYPFVKEALVNLTLEEIDACMEDRHGDRNSNVNISTDTSLDFSIVFHDLPDNVSHFEVEPVSSAPEKSAKVNQP